MIAKGKESINGIGSSGWGGYSRANTEAETHRKSMARNLKQNKLSQKYLADHDDDAQIAQQRAAYHAGLQEPPGNDRPTEKENNKNVVSYLGSTSRLDSREMRSNAFFSSLGDESATSMLTATEINLDCAPEQLSKQLDKTPASELKVFVRDVLEVSDARKQGGYSFKKKSRTDILEFILAEVARKRANGALSAVGSGSGDREEDSDLDAEGNAREQEIDREEELQGGLSEVPDTRAAPALAKAAAASGVNQEEATLEPASGGGGITGSEPASGGGVAKRKRKKTERMAGYEAASKGNG